MQLDSSLLASIAQKGVVHRFPKRTILVHEGDHSDTLFIILDGSVRVYTETDSGKPFVLALLGTGDYFGELALDGGARAASVVTVTATTCAVVASRTLRAFIADHPDFGAHLIHRLIGRIRAMTDDMKGLAHGRVYHRLIALLSKEALPDADGQRVFPAMTHEQIAARLGSTRAMVTRLLKDLRVGGYIAVDNRRISLLKPLPANW